MGLPSLSVCNNTRVLGENLVQSAALFEAGVAALINTEAEKMQRLIARNEGNATLVYTNGQIRDIVCCLKDLENGIIAKVNAGRSIGGF